MSQELAQIKKWLQDLADPECHLCDGHGIFYGNVHICSCIFSTEAAQRLRKSQQKETA